VRVDLFRCKDTTRAYISVTLKDTTKEVSLFHLFLILRRVENDDCRTAILRDDDRLLRLPCTVDDRAQVARTFVTGTMSIAIMVSLFRTEFSLQFRTRRDFTSSSSH
jgi:hypothetical protein